MLLVLACTVFLLFVVPGMLFGLGRMIEANTDGRKRLAAAKGKGLEVAVQATADSHSAREPEQAPWFRRPMLPPFARPTLFE